MEGGGRHFDEEVGVDVVVASDKVIFAGEARD
jgi:hypothetical protein